MIIRDKTNYVMTTATTLTALVKQQDSASTSAATATATATTSAVIKIQCAIRIFVSRHKRDELYIRHIKSQAKVIKKIRQKEKSTRRLHHCAIIIQKNVRMYLIIRRCRCRRQKILPQHKKEDDDDDDDDDKSKNRRKECLVLRRNINALKKQISDINIERREDDDNNNRNYHIMDQNKNRRRKVPQKYSFFGIESLQAEYRSLNIQNKTLDGVLQPLQKNLNSFIKENEQLKNEFHDIYTKNELVRLQNKQSLLLYEDTIQKTNDTKRQLIELLSSTSSSSIEITTVHEQRMDLERRLFSSIEFIQSNNNDKKLINDVTRIGQQAQLEVKERQGVVALAAAAAGFVEPTFQSKNLLSDIGGVVSSSSLSPNKETPIIEQQQKRTPTSNRTKIGHNNNNNNNKREAMGNNNLLPSDGSIGMPLTLIGDDDEDREKEKEETAPVEVVSKNNSTTRTTTTGPLISPSLSRSISPISLASSGDTTTMKSPSSTHKLTASPTTSNKYRPKFFSSKYRLHSSSGRTKSLTDSAKARRKKVKAALLEGLSVEGSSSSSGSIKSPGLELETTGTTLNPSSSSSSKYRPKYRSHSSSKSLSDSAKARRIKVKAALMEGLLESGGGSSSTKSSGL